MAATYPPGPPPMMAISASNVFQLQKLIRLVDVVISCISTAYFINDEIASSSFPMGKGGKDSSQRQIRLVIASEANQSVPHEFCRVGEASIYRGETHQRFLFLVFWWVSLSLHPPYGNQPCLIFKASKGELDLFLFRHDKVPQRADVLDADFNGVAVL